MAPPMTGPGAAPDAPPLEVLITADAAWPVFERLVLSAREDIRAGFRIFDFATALRSPEARAVGRTWGDLIADALRRGVRVSLTVSDFDPVMAADLHGLSLRCRRQAAALAEIVGPEAAARLTVRAGMHPARAGILPRIALAPLVMERMRRSRRRLARRWPALDEIGGRAALPRLHAVSHHHKLAVIDGEVLYIGGLDLNERRFDTPGHDRPAVQTWSDVQVVLRDGDAAAEAARHLAGFEAEIAGRRPAAAGRRLARTLSAPRRWGFWSISPRTLLSEIEADHLDAFRAARRMIHIETQFFRSRRVAAALAAEGRARPDLTLFLVLPSLPEDVAFEGNRGLDARYGLALQAECLDMLRDGFGDRAAILTPVQPVLAARVGPDTLAGSPVIHVHNKVLVADADRALIGSANLNGRSMRWDTEVALRIGDAGDVARLRRALMGHWLGGDDPPPEALDPAAAVRWWRGIAAANAVRRPEARRGLLVPHDADRMADLRQPLPGVTENIV